MLKQGIVAKIGSIDQHVEEVKWPRKTSDGSVLAIPGLGYVDRMIALSSFIVKKSFTEGQ